MVSCSIRMWQLQGYEGYTSASSRERLWSARTKCVECSLIDKDAEPSGYSTSIVLSKISVAQCKHNSSRCFGYGKNQSVQRRWQTVSRLIGGTISDVAVGKFKLNLLPEKSSDAAAVPEVAELRRSLLYSQIRSFLCYGLLRFAFVAYCMSTLNSTL